MKHQTIYLQVMLALACLYGQAVPAQTLDELSQLSRESEISKRCADLKERAALVDSCKKFRPAPVVITDPKSKTGKAKMNQDDSTVITILSAWGIDKSLNAEVQIGDTTKVMQPGDVFQGWKLVKLNDSVAEFLSANGTSRELAFRTGPKLPVTQTGSPFAGPTPGAPLPADLIRK